MNGRKRLKLACLVVARAVGFFALARFLTRGAVKILCYHYVSRTDEEARFPALFITPTSLRNRLDHLRRHYDVISLDQAVTDLRDRRPGRGRVAITFDDGHCSFSEAAVPLLREYGMTATVYVTTARVAGGNPGSLVLLRDVVRRSTVSQPVSPIPEIDMPSDVQAPGAKTEIERQGIRHLMTLPPASAERFEFAQSVGLALAVDVDALMTERAWATMTREEIREVSDEGFGVQVHGHRHRNVVRFADETYDEVVECKRMLEDITGREARDFCYPSGIWNRAAWETLEAAGMRSATTTRFGPNSPETPILALRRIVDAESLTQLEFEFELSGLRWLWHALLHPAERWTPSEKHEPHEPQPKLF